MTTTTQIAYLGEISIRTGLPHEGWAGGLRYDGARDDVRHVAPTVVEHEDLPVTVRAGWGDRIGGINGDELPVWTTPDAAGLEAAAKADGSVRVYRRAGGHAYDTDERPEWLPAFERVVLQIRAAAAHAEATRPDVAAVCAGWRAVLARLDAENEAHARQWAADAAAIARKFRRARVLLGEQTVPGKVCVRSTRGNLLGYADCWDGRWRGTVERLRAA